MPATKTRAAARATGEVGDNGAAEVATATAAPAVFTEADLSEQQDVARAMIEQQVRDAYEQRQTMMGPEIAEPEQWWDIAGYGPVQFVAPGGPLLPHQVIKVGEPAYVFTLILLNQFEALPGGSNAGDTLANFSLNYEVQYQAGNLTTWTLGQPSMQAVHAGNFVPHSYFYVDVLGFIAQQPGLYEMNITSRILGVTPPFVNAPQFAAYADIVYNLDAPGLFGPKPPGPMRFQIYP